MHEEKQHGDGSDTQGLLRACRQAVSSYECYTVAFLLRLSESVPDMPNHHSNRRTAAVCVVPKGWDEDFTML